jgi:hypothetical protein
LLRVEPIPHGTRSGNFAENRQDPQRNPNGPIFFTRLRLFVADGRFARTARDEERKRDALENDTTEFFKSRLSIAEIELQEYQENNMEGDVIHSMGNWREDDDEQNILRRRILTENPDDDPDDNDFYVKFIANSIEVIDAGM